MNLNFLKKIFQRPNSAHVLTIIHPTRYSVENKPSLENSAARLHARLHSTIIAVASQKGAVSKTSTAISLSAGLAPKGKRTALIDIHSQANSFKVFIDDYPKLPKEQTPYTTIFERNQAFSANERRVTELGSSPSRSRSHLSR